MDEKPDEIINHIESQRDQLGRNLDELETRVRRTTNWRTYYERNPMVAAGVALGGGILLGSLIANRGSSSSDTGRGRGYSGSSASTSSFASMGGSSYSPHRSKVTDTLEQVKGAVIAFGIAKAKEFLNDALPGFGEHLSEAERTHVPSSSQSSYGSGYYPSSTHASGHEFRPHASEGASYRGTTPTNAS